MKKKLMILLTLSMALALFANGGGETKTADPAKKTALSVWVPMHNNTMNVVNNLGELDAAKVVAEELNMDITYIHPPKGQTSEHLNLTLASGDLPDIIAKNNMQTYPGGAEGAIDDMLLINMTPYLDEYAPNFMKIVKEYQLEKAIYSDSGVVVLFGAVTFPKEMYGNPSHSVYVRADWLNEFGMDAPETIDEWDTFLRTVKKEKGLASPLTLSGSITGGPMQGSNLFSSAWGVPLKGFYLKGQQVAYGPIQSGYKDFLAKFAQWYADGLIDPDFMLHDYPASRKMFSAGETAAVPGHNAQPALMYDLATDPDFEVASTAYPGLTKGQGSDLTWTMPGVGSNPSWITTVAEKPEEAMRFLDFFYDTKKGNKIAVFGVGKDDTYTVDSNGHYSFTEKVTDNPDLPFHYARSLYSLREFTGQWDWDMEGPQYTEYKCQTDLWEQKFSNSARVSDYISLTVDEGREYSRIMSEVETYQEEMFFKFITGVEPVDNFDSYVKQIKAMGIDRATAIQQAATERFNNR